MEFPKRKYPTKEGWRERSKRDFKIKKLKVGDSFYTYDGYLNHIISITKDLDGNHNIITYRYWLKHKGYWGYNAERMDCALYSMALLNDIEKEDRNKLFELNGEDARQWI